MDNMFDYEKRLEEKGYKLIAGMDEAGRGPLAGAVYTAMVIMPLDSDKIIDGVNDSKKLTPKKRQELYDKIVETAISYAICSVDEKIIDEKNILDATCIGMKNCLENMTIKPDFCLIDYITGLDLSVPFETIIKGDAKSYNIACASILAKVARDKYMEELAKEYPNYLFEKHKGYGTKLHYEMIEKYGILPIHRKSFLKNLGEHIEGNKK